MRRAVATYGRETDARVVVTDGTGLLLADSQRPHPARIGFATPGRPEIGAALAGRSVRLIRHSADLGGSLLVVAYPVLDRGRVIGAVRLSQPIAAVDSRVRRSWLAIGAVAAAVALVGMGVAWLLASSLAQPIHALGVTAGRLGKGDLEARAPEAGPRDVADVARAMNRMADELVGLIEAQREFVGNASHQLRTPLTGLRLRLEAIAAGPPPNADARAGLQEVDRLAGLVADLLVLARAGVPPQAEAFCDLRQQARAAADRWRPVAAEHGQTLALEEPPEAVAVVADAIGRGDRARQPDRERDRLQPPRRRGHGRRLRGRRRARARRGPRHRPRRGGAGVRPLLPRQRRRDGAGRHGPGPRHRPRPRRPLGRRRRARAGRARHLHRRALRTRPAGHRHCQLLTLTEPAHGRRRAYRESMRARLTPVLLVIAALALPAAMAAAVFYASDEAIGDSPGVLTPQFGGTTQQVTPQPATTAPKHHRRRHRRHHDSGSGGATGATTGTTTGADSHGGGTTSGGSGGGSGSGSDGGSGGGSGGSDGGSGSAAPAAARAAGQTAAGTAPAAGRTAAATADRRHCQALNHPVPRHSPALTRRLLR